MVKLLVNKKNEIDDFDSINLLEMSIGLCLLSTIKKKKSSIDSFDLKISANKLRINFYVIKNHKIDFEKLINNCYIIQYLNFEKIIRIKLL